MPYQMNIWLLYRKNTAEENVSQNLDWIHRKTRNYFIKEINWIDLMNKKYKEVFTALNHI